MSKDSKDKMLFKEFTPPSKKDWIEKVTLDLKGADFDKRLVWKNLNGIDIQPFYTRQDQQQTLTNARKNNGIVTNFRRIIATDAREANRLALKALGEGMTGLLFEIRSTIQPEQLLENIDFKGISVSFVLKRDQLSFCNRFKSYLKAQQIDPKTVKGYIDLDIFNNYLESGTLDKELLGQLSELTKTFQAFPEFQTLVLSGTIYQDAGSNQVQEIAYTLSSLVFLIEELTSKGCGIRQIFENLYFILGVSSEYFVEIAKFRVFDNLLNGIAAKYEIDDPKCGLSAKTSFWSKSVTDSNTNMLRTTTEAMSALLGNVDGIELDPYDHAYQEPNDFSRRIAGNIATILKEESYYDKVSNPVDGSYYIEELSLRMAENALELFKGIEADGGFYQAVENERIQNQIAEIRMKKIKLLSQRRQAMVGVNKYPNLMETVPETILNDHMEKENSKILIRQRAGAEMEKIRYNTEHFVAKKGFRPIVEIVSFGQLTMRKARAAFAYDFMGVSGYTIENEKSYNSYEEAVEKASISDSNVVVICSSDPDYEEFALNFVKEFRTRNSSKILLLAGYPEELKDSLLKAGLDGFIHVRSDIFKTLSEVQQKISKTIKTLEI